MKCHRCVNKKSEPFCIMKLEADEMKGEVKCLKEKSVLSHIQMSYSMGYSSIFLAVHERDRRAPPQGAGCHALCSAPYTRAHCNLEMQSLQGSFRINFSNSASLTGVLAVRVCYMGSCQPLHWYERNFKWKMRTCTVFLFWSHLCGWAGN